MPFVGLKLASDLPPGEVAEVWVGSDSYALCHVEGRFYCIDGLCPHAGGPLGQGSVYGTLLTCPWHGWEFECETGFSTCGGGAVTSYPVIVRDGWVCADLPQREARQPEASMAAPAHAAAPVGE